MIVFCVLYNFTSGDKNFGNGAYGTLKPEQEPITANLMAYFDTKSVPSAK